MNMQTRIYAGVTVDVTNLSDLYAAVALVEGAEVVHTATDKFSRRQRTADSRQLDRQPRRRTSAKPEMAKASTDRKSKRHSVANGDPRAVFTVNGHNNTAQRCERRPSCRVYGERPQQYGCGCEGYAAQYGSNSQAAVRYAHQAGNT